MAETNGILKIVRIIGIVIGIAVLLITLGASYGSLNIKINGIEDKTIQIDKRSQSNKDIIISMQSDLKYIIKAVDELRGK